MKLYKAVKRIAALTTSATMLGATILGATAADLSEYPNNFIKDGKFNGLIVVGADADARDVIGGMDIISSLQAIAVGSGSSAVTVETVGDTYKISKASNNFNLGEEIEGLKTTLQDDELPTILADGTLRTSTGDEYPYEQKIKFNNTVHMLKHFADKDYKDEAPTIGIPIEKGQVVLSYELDFTKDAKSVNSTTANTLTSFVNRQLQILGETYDVIAATHEAGGVNIKLTVMKGAIKDSIEEGETKTYTINGKQYEVTALIVDDTNSKVKFKVNGEVTDSMAEADIYKTTDGTSIGVREILPNEAGDVTQDLVEFYLGANKLVLENNQELELDGEDIDRMDVTIKTSTGTASTSLIDKIAIAWNADADSFIADDNEVVMPGLGSIKIYMDGFYTAKQEVITVAPKGDDSIRLTAPLKDYDVALDVLTDLDADGINEIMGASANKRIITNITANTNFTIDEDTDEWFIVTYKSGEDGETYVLSLANVDDTYGIKVKDYAGNSVAENKKTGDTFDIGEVTFTVDLINENASNASLRVDSNQAGMIITKEGLQIQLPAQNVSGPGRASIGLLDQNASSNNANNAQGNYSLIFTEEDKDDVIGNSGLNVWVSAGFTTATEAKVLGVGPANTSMSNGSLHEIPDTDKYVGYTNTSVSSKWVWDKSSDQYDLEITYPGSETYGNVYIGSKASSVKSVGGESATISKIEVGASVLDTSLASYTDKNLIVVGGPAINRAAAALLGKTYPAYGADSGIPENAAILKLVENADNVALIVAGWEADDSLRASRVLAQYDDYTLSGMEVQVTGTSMTDISVSAPAAE